MSVSILSILTAFIISLLANWLLIKNADTLNLLAHPSEHRAHDQVTPLVGGLAMFVAILISLLLYADWQAVQYLVYALTLIAVTGLIDDKHQLPSWLRFIAQGVAIYILIKYTGLQLFDLGNLIGNGQVFLNQWSVVITVFSAIGVINAINMSDGIDGLAASMVLLVLSTLLILGINNVLLVVIVIGALCGFLFFNLRLKRSYAQTFMGDTGSLMLGLILAILLIDNSQGSTRLFPPVTALWLLALPLFDAIAVLILRPLRGKSPFAADRMHYHHLLTDQGVSVNKALIILLFIQTMFISFALLFLYSQVPEYIQFYLFLMLFAGYFFFLIKKTR